MVIELQNADIYQSHFLLLNDVNMYIAEGEFCYVVGKTGTGKSSLLKTIYGALPLQNGEGRVVGMNLKQVDRRNLHLLRRKMGMIFQDFNLLMDRNVEKNLSFVLEAVGIKDKGVIQNKIRTVLDQVGLSFMPLKMPHELSGGEQQRLAVARALLNSPQLIIADEPTGNLDPDTSDDILQLLKNLTKENGTSVIIATHDYRLLDKFPGKTYRCHLGTVTQVSH
ncbi:MAG: ATP-binding cassette domain-containing protein [Saprospiraceae bacterium]|jgi:cell division transport system ATP-binding protein|nr:ATP-binding cassette domain-containing protein [Saprospiraceae bacterium]MBL0294004.1 ATP-binding cassette domain-containing protein [Saprospiraceae bacterium]